jgi:hypothetical protein
LPRVNNHVIKFFLAQVQMGLLERVDYKFFVKGHTKNSCDRGFGHIRKHMAGLDCWTMTHVVDAVKNAAESSHTVHIPRGSDFFRSYKPAVTELYKTLEGVQQFQIFSMNASKPGVVLCKKAPGSEAIEKDLRRKFDGIPTSKDKVSKMFTELLEKLPPPPINTEKVDQMHRQIAPYVPEEYKGDPLYAEPSAEQQSDAKTAKQSRRAHRAAMAVAAKKSQDRRGRQPADGEPQPPRVKKRKTKETQSAVV